MKIKCYWKIYPASGIHIRQFEKFWEISLKLLLNFKFCPKTIKCFLYISVNLGSTMTVKVDSQLFLIENFISCVSSLFDHHTCVLLTPSLSPPSSTTYLFICSPLWQSAWANYGLVGQKQPAGLSNPAHLTLVHGMVNTDVNTSLLCLTVNRL